MRPTLTSVNDVFPSGNVGPDTDSESDGTCVGTLRKTSVKINIERVETWRGGVITKVHRTATLEYSQAGKMFQDAYEVVQEMYDFLHDEFMDNLVWNLDFLGILEWNVDFFGLKCCEVK